MFTKKERDYYNKQREKTCQSLGITKYNYNWLRRKGEALQDVYIDSCNGVIAEDAYDLRTGDLEGQIYAYLHDNRLNTKEHKLYVYFQTDPRGATIYIDTKEIPENNYTQARCIY